MPLVKATDAKSLREHALNWACKLHRADAVEFLLNFGVDPAAKGFEGMTALHLAAWHGFTDLIPLLLSHGAPLEAKNMYGGTVVDMTVWAARNAPVEGVDYAPIVETLLRAGADVEAVSPFPTGIAAIDEVLRRHGKS